ncbi:MAG: 4Fe-4S dicluster domain-containing protein [Aggregatilineales bacterium]
MNALQAAQQLVSITKGVPLQVYPDQCVRARNKHLACNRCAVVCPVNAIVVQENRVTVDSDACVKCGACLHVCPAAAFSGYDGVDKLLGYVKSLPNAARLELACPHRLDLSSATDPASALLVITRCLVSLSPSTYVELFNRGAQIVLLRLDACAGCPLQRACSTIEQTAERINQLYNDQPDRAVVIVKTRPAASESPAVPLHVNRPAISRRGLFSLLRPHLDDQDAAAPASDACAPFMHERARLLRAIAASPDREAMHTESLFSSLKMTGVCSACEVCAVVCPTQALRIEKSTADFSLTFDTGACTRCDLCVELCPERALAYGDPPSIECVNAGGTETLAAGSLTRCRRCGATFADAKGMALCPPCLFRRQNPFGLTDMTHTLPVRGDQ